MPKITIDVSENVAARLQEVLKYSREGVDKALALYNSLPSSVRAAADVAVAAPEAFTDEQVYAQLLRLGAEVTLAEGRFPNVVLGLGTPRDQEGWPRRYKKGEPVTAVGALPVGSEVLAMAASAEDGPNWDVAAICFGSLNILSPYAVHGRVALSDLLYLSNKGLLSAFDGKKTICDVQVRVTLVCKTDGAEFAGYSVHVKQEEQLSLISCRLEPARGAGLLTGQR